MLRVPELTDALIVCTRNRAHQIYNRLQELQQFSTLPSVVVIVDSSDSAETEEAVKKTSPQFPATIKYIRSEPGLPYQRNVGIEWARKNNPKLELIHFLDDDIIPRSDYFSKIRQICHDAPELVALGGFDSDLSPNLNSGLMRRLMGIGTKKCGLILKSGIAVPPFPQSSLETCQWLVGGMQSVRAWVFNHLQFDAALRMYGEDIDFYLRICNLGEIATSIHLPVKHLNDPSNRDSLREVNLYHNGVRWLLASRYPEKVSRIRVVQVASVLAVGEAARFVMTRDRKYLSASRGNFEFLYRLIRRKSVVQLVEQR